MTVLDLFAGPGGWSEASRDLGLAEVGVEWDPPTNNTAEAAGHGPRVQADVRYVMAPAHLEGLIASPPCQTFSTAGTGNGRRLVEQLVAAVPHVAAGASIGDALGPPSSATYDEAGALFGMDESMDPRGALVLEPMRFVRAGRPTWVAMEQVPAVLPIWDAYAVALARVGYHTLTGIVSAEAYGVPQTRRRAVLLAHKERPVSWPRPTHSRYHRDGHLDPGMPRWVSMAEALGWDHGDLVGFPRRADDQPSMVLDGSHYRARDLRTAGDPAQAVTEKARSWVRWRVNDQSGTARVPDWPWNRPATTVAGRDLIPDPGPNANRFNGSTKSRNDGIRVTLDEAATLQGFPHGYPWQGTRSERFQQVGDAVPPPLARALLGSLCFA